MNIFKTCKENKALKKQNEDLKLQIEALNNFKDSFKAFYNGVNSFKIVQSTREAVNLKAVATHEVGMPTEYIKDVIARDLVRQIKPFIEYDITEDFTRDGLHCISGTISINK